MKVCVIGLGTVGLPSALNFHRAQFDVFGHDIKPVDTPFPTYTNWDDVPRCDLYVVAVGTGFQHGKPDVSSVSEVAQKVALGDPGAKISIESTVPVGTCREIQKQHDLQVAHCPHRYWAGDPERHGVKQVRVLGAVEESTLEQVATLYAKASVPVCVLRPVELAELCKIAENAWRFMQIAFVEELAMVCDDLGLDFYGLRDAMNTKWNVDIGVEPRDGVVGSCLPKDIRYLASLVDWPSLLTGAVKADEAYREWVKRKRSRS